MTPTRAGVLAHRLERQFLGAERAADAATVVARLGGVLAHDPVAAELAVALRCTDPTPGAVGAAGAAGDLVSIFTFRGAVHHVAVEQAGAWLALRGAGRQWERKSWREAYRLEPEDWPALGEAVRGALADGPLTPKELGAALAAYSALRHLGPVFDDDPWALLKALCWQGVLAVGPAREGRTTLVDLADTPRWRGLWPLKEAGPFAVRHYLDAYGPATPEHLHHWLGAGLSAGRRRIEGWLQDVADDLLTLDIEGQEVLALAEHEDSLRTAEGHEAVHLLPGHDQWVMGPGTQDEDVVPPALRPAVSRGSGLVLVCGVVRGTWRLTGGDVEVAPAEGVVLPDQALATAVERLVACARLTP